MKRQAVVVFERVVNGIPELDWRPIRAALPAGGCPLAIADRDGFSVHCGQDFLPEEIISLAEGKSGYVSAATIDKVDYSFVQYPR